MNSPLAPQTLMPSHRLFAARERLFFKQQLVLLALMVSVRLVSLYAVPAEIGQSAKIKGLGLPATLAGWKGRDIKIDQFTLDFLKPDAIVQKRYEGPGSDSRRPQIEVLVMYTRNAEGFHPPDVCMKAQGWVVSQHEMREVKAQGKSLQLDVVTGEQREQRKLLAYSFSDATGAVSGRTATFANMVMARFLRRRVGALEIQFAYDARVLTENGDFSPPFKNFMIETAQSIYGQMKAQTGVSS